MENRAVTRIQLRIKRDPTPRQILRFVEQVARSGREILLRKNDRTVRASSIIGVVSLGLRSGDLVSVFDYSGECPLTSAAALLGDSLLS